jgi:hypothetical protein
MCGIGFRWELGDGDGIQVEFGRGGWHSDPFTIDFQFSFSGRAQLPPTQRNFAIVPSRNDVWA